MVFGLVCVALGNTSICEAGVWGEKDFLIMISISMYMYQIKVYAADNSNNKQNNIHNEKKMWKNNTVLMDVFPFVFLTQRICSVQSVWAVGNAARLEDLMR